MPGGFKYIGTDGGDSGQRLRTYKSDAAARRVAVGDLMVVTGTADSTTGRPVATTCTGTISTVGATGVLVAIVPSFATESLSSTGVAASTAAEFLICDDVDALFEVDTTTTLAVTDVGLNVSVTATQASVTGNVYTSNMVVVTPATDADRPFRIVSLTTGATGTLGERVVVRFNSTTAKAAVAGI